MDKIHKLVLQRNRAYLVDEIIIEGLWDHLESAGIFPPKILQECQAQPSPTAQIRKMLTLLERRGPTAYPKFIECLQSAEQEHIAEHLIEFESNEKTKSKPISNAIVTSSNQTQNSTPLQTTAGDAHYKPANNTDPQNNYVTPHHNQAPVSQYYEAIQQPYQQNEPTRNSTPRFSSSRHKPYSTTNHNPGRPNYLPTNQSNGSYPTANQRPMSHRPTFTSTNQNSGNHVTSSESVSLNDVQIQSPDTTEHIDHPLRTMNTYSDEMMESSGQSIETDAAPVHIKPLKFTKYNPAEIEKLKQQKDKHGDFVPSLPGVGYDDHKRNRTPTPPVSHGVSCADAPNGLVCESNGYGDRMYAHADFNGSHQGCQLVQNPYPEQFGIPHTSGRLDLIMNSYNQQMFERVNSSDCYPMNSNPRGYCLIINNKIFTGHLKERLGTDVDRDNLFYLFSELGYEICKMDNLSAMDMLLTLKHFAQMQEHYGVDSCVIILLTHGVDGQVYGSDCKLAKLDEIFSYYDGDVCPGLKGKPKFFIIQACRGEQYDSGFEMTDGGGRTDNGAPSEVHMMQEQEMQDHQILKQKLPSLSDFLVAYATVPGFVSWRNDEMGSWFVQALCETFSERSNSEDALNMLVEVNNKVATVYQTKSQFKQMPAPVVSLRKKLYFNVPAVQTQ